MRYIMRDTGDNTCGYFNSAFSEDRKFFAEVEAAIFRATSLKIPVIHFVISFTEEEKKFAFENVEKIASFFLKKMSMNSALAAFGAHTDSDNFHIHIGVVMLDLVTMKSFNQIGIVRQIMDATSDMCKEFDFSSPLHDYRMILHGIKSCFESADWDIIHDTLETMSVQVENNSDKTGYVLKTGRWDVELGAITGFPSAERYFQQMGPVPFKPKKTLPEKPNFWVTKKAAMAVVYKEKRRVTEEFDKRLDLAKMYARCREDEEKAWAEMEVDALEDDRLRERNIFHYYSSVIRSITQEAWNQRWKEIESALWDWTINKNRTDECLARLDATPTKAQPDRALLKMA